MFQKAESLHPFTTFYNPNAEMNQTVLLSGNMSKDMSQCAEVTPKGAICDDPRCNSPAAELGDSIG